MYVENMSLESVTWQLGFLEPEFQTKCVDAIQVVFLQPAANKMHWEQVILVGAPGPAPVRVPMPCEGRASLCPAPLVACKAQVLVEVQSALVCQLGLQYTLPRGTLLHGPAS